MYCSFEYDHLCIIMNSSSTSFLYFQSGHGETIENLSDEMREDYLLSVKKAIGK